jgi:hypothetical protein
MQPTQPKRNVAGGGLSSASGLPPELRRYIEELQREIQVLRDYMNVETPGRQDVRSFNVMSDRVDFLTSGQLRFYGKTISVGPDGTPRTTSDRPVRTVDIGSVTNRSGGSGSSYPHLRGAVAMIQAPGGFIYDLSAGAGVPNFTTVKIFQGTSVLPADSVMIHYQVTDRGGTTTVSQVSAEKIKTENDVEVWSDEVNDGFTPAADDAFVQVGVGVTIGDVVHHYPSTLEGAIDWTYCPSIPVITQPGVLGTLVWGLGTVGV